MWANRTRVAEHILVGVADRGIATGVLARGVIASKVRLAWCALLANVDDHFEVCAADNGITIGVVT
jgi:hypothetical protein